jgi:hypothetical protein
VHGVYYTHTHRLRGNAGHAVVQGRVLLHPAEPRQGDRGEQSRPAQLLNQKNGRSTVAQLTSHPGCPQQTGRRLPAPLPVLSDFSFECWLLPGQYEQLLQWDRGRSRPGVDARHAAGQQQQRLQGAVAGGGASPPPPQPYIVKPLASASRPFPSWKRFILTEIYLCHACSYHANEDGNARAGGGHRRAVRPRHLLRAGVPRDAAGRAAVPPPEPNDHDQNSGLTDIYLCF